jgi:carbon storage regulator CsrA
MLIQARRVGTVERICFPERRKSISLRGPAARKPGAAVSGRPFNACVSPMEAPGETSVSRGPQTNTDPLELRATLLDAGRCRTTARYGRVATTARPDEGEM